jgi:hypothetical protein
MSNGLFCEILEVVTQVLVAKDAQEIISWNSLGKNINDACHLVGIIKGGIYHKKCSFISLQMRTHRCKIRKHMKLYISGKL